MAKSENKVLKSGIWYTISNFFLKGIVFVTTPIFTRLLSQTEFGAFTNFTSWLNMLMVVTTLNVEATLLSARYEHEDKLDEYISSVLALSMLSTSAWWFFVTLFIDEAMVLFDMSQNHINMMFAYLFVLPAINLFQTRERFFYRYKMSVALSMCLSIGSSLLAVLLVMTMNDRLDGRVFGYVIPGIIIGIGITIYLIFCGKRINIGYWNEALKIVLPFIPHLLSLSILNMVDRVMITKMCGEEATALYGLAYNVAMIITLLLSSLNGAFSPWLGGKLANKEYKDIRSVSKIYIMLFVYFAIGVMLVSPEILLILGGESYTDAKWVMLPIALGCVCQFIYTLFVNVEQFEKKTVGMAFASVSAAIINFILNAWLIPRFGYIAAAYTTLIGYMWLLLAHMYLVYKLKMSHVYSYRFVFLAFGIACFSAAVTYVLYNMNWIRYIVILAYALVTLIFAWKNKDRLIGFIKK